LRRWGFESWSHKVLPFLFFEFENENRYWYGIQVRIQIFNPTGIQPPSVVPPCLGGGSQMLVGSAARIRPAFKMGLETGLQFHPVSCRTYYGKFRNLHPHLGTPCSFRTLARAYCSLKKEDYFLKVSSIVKRVDYVAVIILLLLGA
jgi:hypothetical protein